MNYVESLRRAVENRSYDETTEYMKKICEGVLGYKKIAECSPEDKKKEEFDSIENEIDTVIESFIPKLLSEIIPPEILLNPTKTSMRRLIILVEAEARQTSIVTDRCWHYANSSTEKPEGIIAKLLYKRTANDLKLMEGIRGFPPISIRGYGEKWWDEGELSVTPSCFKTNLQLSQDISSISKIDFKRFNEIIKGV